MSKIIELEVNGTKYNLDWEMYLKEKEYLILKERPLVPEILWSMFGLDEETLSNVRKQIKELNNDSTGV